MILRTMVLVLAFVTWYLLTTRHMIPKEEWTCSAEIQTPSNQVQCVRFERNDWLEDL